MNKPMKVKTAIKIALDALRDYRRRNFAIGHNAFVQGQRLIFTEKDHLAYERYSQAMAIIAGLDRPAFREEDAKIHILNLTDEQNAWLNNFYGSTCIEPMFLEELEAGTKTFEDAAQENVSWYESHFADAMNSISHIPTGEKQ